MVGPLKGDHLAAFAALVAPPLPGDLEGHFHGGGAVVGEEQPLEARERTESGGELLGGFVAEVGEDHLLQLLGLAGDRRRNGWLGVAVQGHPPAADGVN